MGKADEERLAIGVQKYPCLYGKAVSAFHNKNQKKNDWETVAKDIGLENRRSYKECFLNESATIMRISFDFGAIIIFLFGLIFLILLASLKTQGCRKASDHHNVNLKMLSENQSLLWKFVKVLFYIFSV